MARIISEVCPGLKCTVLDLPHVVAGLPESENVKFVGGDMFESIPSADAILLKVVGLSPFVAAMLDPALVTPWHFLGDWLQGNNDNDRRDKLINPFEAAHGVNLWDYGRKNPEFGNTFNRAMASDSQMMNLVIQDCKEIFEGLNSLVDVGGGTGIVARIISEACPWLKCTVLDLPQVVAGLPDSETLKFVGGDMFESIPSTDAILLKVCTIAFRCWQLAADLTLHIKLIAFNFLTWDGGV
ncbi:hypothetical protein NL676_008209 [Syzygium grande]|nr:hypothetical protein NL676_008209 [Syzygium grande]